MSLRALLSGAAPLVRVRIAQVAGSSPREEGAFMLVSPDVVAGTIGGGAMEYAGIDRARRMLARGEDVAVADIALGPESGQCCGGRVLLEFDVLDAAGRAAVLAEVAAAEAAQPEVLIFGAGHVGRALARALALLPVRCVLIDSRAEELALAQGGTQRRTAFPEAEVASAAPGAAVVIATHDHGLDFLLAGEALARGDLAYVGMIGSNTKRARFASWARDHATGAELARLTCPMAANAPADKRPEVIAAFVATEVLAAVLAFAAARAEVQA
ncbi:xanthine dehydrogenase accessory protein XdhC [Rhodalgimonas zhirmunskyi]|uniref:Xanthine dehydrogenase accessory protein XdhC n=1 Tax=Rhodalgimonas zhirmunskyi TaxID=2964767 RepID=A0AAJ1UC99_9RHOB|nr:xanthine dehydrogenase accessory protein XdhC [Rhodoalgimonas zhirmunskyi]MDQ2094878.1 xanthine dehydrogenase accessory protein XdhC [Rhodoalgimonas zhirmunskyi]